MRVKGKADVLLPPTLPDEGALIPYCLPVRGAYPICCLNDALFWA